jgi:hypothetical protein
VKRLFYLSASILMLALAFHFGYTTTMAQAPSNPVAAAPTGSEVTTANDNVYVGGGAGFYETWTRFSNIFSGGPVPTQQESWGQLKSRYAPSHASTSQTPTNK